MAQLCKVSAEDVETLSAMVKLTQEIDESARESEYCDFDVKRVLARNGGEMGKTQWLSTKRRGRSSSWSWGVSISSTTRLITSLCVEYPVRRRVRQER